MMIQTKQRRSSQGARRGGFVLLAVLLVISVLSLAAYQYTILMDAELTAAQRIRRGQEAKNYADSGIHYTMAMLADSEAFQGTLGSNPFDNPGAFQGIAVGEPKGTQKQGRFSVIAFDLNTASSSGGAIAQYGVVDETGKININALIKLDPTGRILHNTLVKLPEMTDEIAWNIVKWVAPPSSNITSGADDTFYQSQKPSYSLKQGPLDSVDELLLVSGVTPDLLYGSDPKRNGSVSGGATGGYSPGWQAYLTVYSREQNVRNNGEPRININGTDINKIYNDLIAAVGQDLATFIVSYRVFGSGTQAAGGMPMGATAATPGNITDLGTQLQNQLAQSSMVQARQQVSSLFSLVNATITVAAPMQAQQPTPKGKGANQPAPMQMQQIVYTSPLANTATQSDLLTKLMDSCTTFSGTEIPARVNVNTAPREVLLSLPGLTEADADLIVSKRPGKSNGLQLEGNYSTPAWLLFEAQIPVATLQSLERYVTARTQVYRAISVGFLDGGGPTARVEAVIDTNQGFPRIVYYRDLTEYGRSQGMPE